MTMMEIRASNSRRLVANLVPATFICLFVSFLLEQEAFGAEAFHTSSTTRTLRKSKFGVYPHSWHGMHMNIVRRSFLPTNLKKEDDDDDDDGDDSIMNDEIALTQYLQKAQDRALAAFAATEAPSWMMERTDTETLPFSCTGCGKCCQTTGSVYMSPAEYNQAADYLNVTTSAFKQEYASHTLAAVPAPRTVAVLDLAATNTNTATAATTAAIAATAAEPWICIKDQTQTTAESVDTDADAAATAPACIFLDRTTNQCQIYPVRPVQCRTYPFWPTVTASVQSWNDECRRLEIMTNDDDGNGSTSDDNDGDSDIANSDATDSSSFLPRWTPELGGCEGMRVVAAVEEETTPTATATTSVGDLQHLSEGTVPRQTALESLYDYVKEERRFPHAAPEVPVERMSD
jgi:Fe-S-cluster containining protein